MVHCMSTHVQMLSGIHLCNVNTPMRSSLVKLDKDYLVLKQFQREAVLSAQMWVQFETEWGSKENKHLPDPIFLPRKLLRDEKYHVSKTMLVMHNMIFCLFIFRLSFLDLLNHLIFLWRFL